MKRVCSEVAVGVSDESALLRAEEHGIESEDPVGFGCAADVVGEGLALREEEHIEKGFPVGLVGIPPLEGVVRVVDVTLSVRDVRVEVRKVMYVSVMLTVVPLSTGSDVGIP